MWTAGLHPSADPGQSMFAKSWKRMWLRHETGGKSVSLRSRSRAATPWGVEAVMKLFGKRSLAALMKKIADAGLLIAFLDRKDEYHPWAARIFERESPPFYTAEAILAEVAAVLESADEVLQMIELGDLVVALDLQTESSAIRAMIRKYKDRKMDLGDACCVRLSELLAGSVVYTVDKKDFTIYRKNNRQPVPCIFPSS
jgi:predicted nucleic acid-binding protein